MAGDIAPVAEIVVPRIETSSPPVTVPPSTETPTPAIISAYEAHAPVTAANARVVLEAGAGQRNGTVAEGESHTETTTPQEPESVEKVAERETIQKSLAEIGKLLLELKDTRIILIALAKKAGNSPLADEMRKSLVVSLSETTIDAGKNKKVKAELKTAQDKVKSMQLVEPPFAGSAFESILQKMKIPEDTMKSIKDSIGKKEASLPEIINELLHSKEFGEKLKAELYGEQGAGFPKTNGDIVRAVSGAEPTQKQLKTMKDMMNRKPETEPLGKLERIGMSIMLGAVLVQLMAQFSAEAQTPNRSEDR